MLAPQPIVALLSGSVVRVRRSVLAPGNAVTVPGTPLSLESNNNLIIGSSTLTFSVPVVFPTTLPSPIATVASQPIIALPSYSGVRIGSSTLPVGNVVTISGTHLSLRNNNDLVNGSSTLTISQRTASPPFFTLTIATIASQSSLPSHRIWAYKWIRES